MATVKPKLSIVVPLFNEALVLKDFHDSLTVTLKRLDMSYEIIYCDDGSTDTTNELARAVCHEDKRVRLLTLSRNFGKEVATSAGIAAARGEAIITIDADGQHPVELLPEFIWRWQEGKRVIIGLRTANQKEGWVKRLGSKLFYGLYSKFTGIKLVAGSTDYRLIDASVQREFLRMTERNRITRGLIDWLGYERAYITFRANPRLGGEATYSFKKLVKLAIDSAISLSLSPLYIAAYLGAIVLPLATIVGIGMVINAAIGDRLHLHATGSAYVMILVLFLVGVLLVSQGIIGLYLSHIHTETQNRPLYVIDTEKSVGL